MVAQRAAGLLEKNEAQESEIETLRRCCIHVVRPTY